MNISDLIQTVPIACRSDVDVVELAQNMISEGVGSMAVLDGQRLIGIVTDRDIVAAVARSDLEGATAGDIMTDEPDTIEVDMDVDDAIDWLNATGYRHLPVTDGGQLVGIISIKDLLWAVSSRAKGNTL
jgi:CBS domain-containing protein